MNAAPHFARRKPRRNVDSILERAHRRWSSNDRLFAPDFVHGSFVVSKGVEWLGEETLTIAHPFSSATGETQWVITRMSADHGFLSVSQSLQNTPGERVDAVIVDTSSDVTMDSIDATFFCRASSLERLESRAFGVRRDMDRGWDVRHELESSASVDALSLLGILSMKARSSDDVRLAA